MSRKYQFKNPAGVYFISFAVKDWVDVFTRNEYKNTLIESLHYCQSEKGMEVFAWCIMTNHSSATVYSGRKEVLRGVIVVL